MCLSIQTCHLERLWVVRGWEGVLWVGLVGSKKTLNSIIVILSLSKATRYRVFLHADLKDCWVVRGCVVRGWVMGCGLWVMRGWVFYHGLHGLHGFFVITLLLYWKDLTQNTSTNLSFRPYEESYDPHQQSKSILLILQICVPINANLSSWKVVGCERVRGCVVSEWVLSSRYKVLKNA